MSRLIRIRVTEHQETAEGWDGDAGRTGRCDRAQVQREEELPGWEDSVIQGERGQGHTRPGAMGWRPDPILGLWIEALSRESHAQLMDCSLGVLGEQGGSGEAAAVPVRWTWTQLATPPSKNLQECEEPGPCGCVERGSLCLGGVPLFLLLWKEPSGPEPSLVLGWPCCEGVSLEPGPKAPRLADPQHPPAEKL